MKDFTLILLEQTPFSEWQTLVWKLVKKFNAIQKEPMIESVLLDFFEACKLEVPLTPERIKKEEQEKVNFTPALPFSELIQTTFPDIRFCIEPLFEHGTVNMLSAPPSNWKSWFLFLFSQHIANGTAVFGQFKCEKAKVLIVNEEDTLRLIQDRYKILGITDTTLPIYFRVAHGAKMTEEWVKLLIAEAKELGVTVIMFDSLRALNDANENDSQEMQKVMDLFKLIAKEGITVFFTHHHKKKPSFGKQDDTEASRGSTSINAAVAGHISLQELERDGQKLIVVQHLKIKVSEKIPSFEVALEYNRDEIGKVKGIAFKYAGEFKKSEQKLVVAKDGIMSELKAGEWKSAKELFEMKIAGMSSIRQALSVLSKDGLVLSLNRKQLMERNITPDSIGKPNEKLYSLNDHYEEEESPMQEAIDEF